MYLLLCIFYTLHTVVNVGFNVEYDICGNCVSIFNDGIDNNLLPWLVLLFCGLCCGFGIDICIRNVLLLLENNSWGFVVDIASLDRLFIFAVVASLVG